MKYKIFIILLCVYTNAAYATTIDDLISAKIEPAQFIGKWSCSQDFESEGFHQKEQASVEFKKNGDYIESSKSQISKDGEVANYQTKTQSNWTFSINTIIFSQFKRIDFQVDNENLEKQVKLRSSWDDQMPFVLFIKKIDPHHIEFISSLDQLDSDTVQMTCIR